MWIHFSAEAHTHKNTTASGQLTSRTCRDEWEDYAILSTIREPPMSLDQDNADSSDVLVSIIMAGKLDDRRGDSVGRMQNSIDAALHAMAKHQVGSHPSLTVGSLNAM